MLRTAPTEDTPAERDHADIPWPPTIKPPTLRALPASAREASAREASAREASARKYEERAAPRHIAGARIPQIPRTLWLWLAVYAVLNIGDLISTYLGLQSGLHEGNPLMRAMLLQHGFTALILYKLVVVVAVVAGICVLYRRHARLATVTLVICNVLVGLAVLLNFIQFAIL